MLVLLAILPIVALIVVANLVDASRKPRMARLFNAGLFALGLALFVPGVALSLMPAELEALFAANSLLPLNVRAAGITFALMGVWGMLASLAPVRRQLARILPIAPAAAVHTLALFLSGVLIGNSVFTLGQGGLAELETTAVSVPITDVVLQQAGFAILAFAGVGAFVRRGGTAVLQRLGLVRPTAMQLRSGLRWMVGMLAIQWAVGVAWALANPDQATVLSNVNEAFLGDIDSLGEWFVLALAAGIGEETLFRGALQPAFGLVATAALFSVVHVQYGLTPITLAVFLIGLMLGVLRRRTNTTVAIAAHFGYNFTLGLLSLLVTYAAQFTP